MRLKAFILTAFLAFAIIMSGYSQTVVTEDSIDTQLVEYDAMGGLHAASAEGYTTLFTNPAGLSEAEPQFSVSELTIGATGKIFDIAGIVIDVVGGAEVEKLLTSSSVSDLLSGLYTSVNIGGPLSFGYVGNGLGFNITNSQDVILENAGALNVNMTVSETVLLQGGYGVRFMLPPNQLSELEMGLLLRSFIVGQLQMEKNLLELVSLLQNLDFSILTSQSFSVLNGIGVDLGLRYEYDDFFAFGITIQDVYTPTVRSYYTSLDEFLGGSEVTATQGGIVPLNLSAGVQLRPEISFLQHYISDIRFLLDYRDILDFVFQNASARHWVLHLSFGMELTFLEILSLRGGFAEGLFAAGMGIDLTVFQLQAAMFGSELSTDPGLRPAYNFALAFEFRI